MAEVQNIYEYICRLAPIELAEHWDNPGLLVNAGGKINKVLVCLDITDDTLLEAEEKGCELIISHHPVIFDPLKNLDVNNVACRALQKGISCICMHTNLDAAEGGVNDTLASLLGIQNIESFAEGMGRIGDIQETDAETLADFAAQALDTSVKFADGGKVIRRLAVVSGAGGSLLQDAIAVGADALLTGEANHHAAIDARHVGVTLIAATHFATEFPVVGVLAETIAAQYPELKVMASEVDHDPFRYIDN